MFAGMLYAWKPRNERAVVAFAVNPPLHEIAAEPLVKRTVRWSVLEKFTSPEPVGYAHTAVKVADVAPAIREAVAVRFWLPTVVVVTVRSLSKYL